MLDYRPSASRGHGQHGWLDTRHSFSFGDWFDPKRVGFRSLRVLNDDRVAPGEGFPPHPHRDMEIISYVVSGALAHRDSSGGEGVIRRGEVQRMTAGIGVTHSEFNASKTEPVHFLQIWIVPTTRGVEPGYEQRRLVEASSIGKFGVVASPDARGGSLKIGQDAVLLSGRFVEGEATSYDLVGGRYGYVHVIEGEATVNGVAMATGDGLAMSQEPVVKLVARGPVEVLLFDLG